VQTLFKRRRYLPDINSRNQNLRQFAERQAINTPVQGTAADLIKLAMVNIDEQLKNKNLKSKLIITVHDELVFDLLKEEKDAVADLVRQEMEESLKLSVPIKASVKIGPNWLELEKFKDS
jgi:DNA polymerase-1